MYRIQANPILYRITLWLAAVVLVISAWLFWDGGLGRVVEYLNDLFLLNQEDIQSFLAIFDSFKAFIVRLWHQTFVQPHA